MLSFINLLLVFSLLLALYVVFGYARIVLKGHKLKARDAAHIASSFGLPFLVLNGSADCPSWLTAAALLVGVALVAPFWVYTWRDFWPHRHDRVNFWGAKRGV